MKGIDLFLVGQEVLRKEHAAEAQAKTHTLRGGSAGCLLEDGTTLGACPHEALGRFMGYEADSIDSQGYFDGGIANELIWERNIKAALAQEEVPYDSFRCEEDIPVSYRLDDKYNITGRPDLVVGSTKDGEFVPELGMELKGCYAVRSGARKLFGLEPDGKHICQAAFYMKVLDIPWTIPYTVNVTGELGWFDKKDYGKHNLPLGKVEFPLRYGSDGNTVEYQDVGGKWIRTVITWDGILDFYRLVADMYKSKQVGVTRISDMDAFGQPVKFDYNLYNSFTLMVPVDQGWDAFVEHAKKLPTAKRSIKYSKGKYVVLERVPPSGPLYRAEGEFIKSCKTIAEARELAYEKYSC